MLFACLFWMLQLVICLLIVPEFYWILVPKVDVGQLEVEIWVEPDGSRWAGPKF